MGSGSNPLTMRNVGFDTCLESGALPPPPPQQEKVIGIIRQIIWDSSCYVGILADEAILKSSFNRGQYNDIFLSSKDSSSKP
jgi:hypothetical protein